jgi:hypothetical protein
MKICLETKFGSDLPKVFVILYEAKCALLLPAATLSLHKGAFLEWHGVRLLG